MRDPKLTREEATRLLDPANNELIPGGPNHDNDGTLLDPAMNELIDGPDAPMENPPNDLCPGYVVPKPKPDAEPKPLMDVLKDAAGGGDGCGRVLVHLGGGLTASSCPSGGLSIFKDGRQLYSTEDLSPEDRQTVKDFREKFADAAAGKE